jgi:hypothetical protein
MMMKAVRTSETSVYFCETTRRYIPAGYLDTRRRENLESQSESDQSITGQEAAIQAELSWFSSCSEAKCSDSESILKHIRTQSPTFLSMLSLDGN